MDSEGAEETVMGTVREIPVIIVIIKVSTAAAVNQKKKRSQTERRERITFLKQTSLSPSQLAITHSNVCVLGVISICDAPPDNIE